MAIQGLPNSPASVASRYFLAPQAKILRFSRPRWSISRQNEAPWSSTGRTKVVRNFELSTKMLLAHALLAGKALGPHQGFYLPSLAAYVQGGISCRGGAFTCRGLEHTNKQRLADSNRRWPKLRTKRLKRTFRRLLQLSCLRAARRRSRKVIVAPTRPRKVQQSTVSSMHRARALVSAATVSPCTGAHATTSAAAAALTPSTSR